VGVATCFCCLLWPCTLAYPTCLVELHGELGVSSRLCSPCLIRGADKQYCFLEFLCDTFGGKRCGLSRQNRSSTCRHKSEAQGFLVRGQEAGGRMGDSSAKRSLSHIFATAGEGASSTRRRRPVSRLLDQAPTSSRSSSRKRAAPASPPVPCPRPI
jgi:hypothetical protein